MSSMAAVVAALAAGVVAAMAAAPSGVKLVIAHRGASGYLPEHTLPAVAMAHALGADYIEQDVVLSKDNVPMVLHDIHLDTVTDVARRFPDRKREDGRYYVIDFTLAELKQLNASERFDPKTGLAVFPTRFPAGKGSFQIPTLEEELQLIQGLNTSTGRDVGVYPEVKEPAWHRTQGRDLSPILLEVLARYGYKTKADKVYVQCFDEREVKRIRTELGYKGRLIQLIEGSRPMLDEQKHLRTPAGLAETAKYADGIGPSLSDIIVKKADGGYEATSLVRDAHAAGLEVHPYTFRADALPPGIASLEDLLRLALVDVGVDGVFTDQTDRAVAFLRKR